MLVLLSVIMPIYRGNNPYDVENICIPIDIYNKYKLEINNLKKNILM